MDEAGGQWALRLIHRPDEWAGVASGPCSRSSYTVALKSTYHRAPAFCRPFLP